jgi:hypothetical protein
MSKINFIVLIYVNGEYAPVASNHFEFLADAKRWSTQACNEYKTFCSDIVELS